MFIHDYMSRAPITISQETPVLKALSIMKKNKIRQLPVVLGGKLIGLVTEKDLLNVSPSPATSLSIFEVNYLLAKITVKDAMVKDVMTVTPDTTIEETALLMREHKINSVPVVENDALVGIITDSDIFDAMVKLFGYGKPGVRMVIEAKDRVGLLADITKIVKEFDIIIRAVVTVEKANQKADVVLRLGIVDPAPLVEALEKNGFKVTYIS
ncbi:MAG: CBS domain-containing protein [Peptococcaceae bacterium]|nr:CBS domain-containing protein [Peptococcaceae bacterium]